MSRIDSMNPVCKGIPDTLCIIINYMVVRRTYNIVVISSIFGQPVFKGTVVPLANIVKSTSNCSYLARELRILEVAMWCHLPSPLESSKSLFHYSPCSNDRIIKALFSANMIVTIITFYDSRTEEKCCIRNQKWPD